jgi:hypothetical protein
MRVERRGRIVRVRSAVNHRWWEEPGERAEAEAVCDLQAGRLGGLVEGQGQQGRGRRRRAVTFRVRGGPQGEPLQALEPAVVGELLPAAGARGRDTEARRQPENSRGADGRGQGRSDGRGRVPGARGGASLPPRLLRLPAGPLGAGRGRGLPGALLASGLGLGPGPEVVFRQRPVGPRFQGGSSPHRPALRPALRGAVAQGAAPARGRQPGRA